MSNQANLTRPDFQITANSKDRTKELTDRVASIDVIEHAGFEADQLIITLDDHPKHRVQLPKTGDKIGIALGYEGKRSSGSKHWEDFGQFEVVEYSLSGPRETMVIYANKMLLGSDFKAPKQVSWPSTPDNRLTLGRVVDDIAGYYGLSSAISGDLSAIELPQIEQSESDMHLLTRLAAIVDATAKVTEEHLLFIPRCSGRTRSGRTIPTINFSAGNMIRWEMLSSAQPFYQSCKAYYYDWGTAQRHVVSVGSGSPCFTLNHTFADEATAQQAAKARLNDFKRTQNTISVTVIGQQELLAGGIVDIKGVRAQNSSTSGGGKNLSVDGKWSLTKVHHRIDSSGFVSHFEGQKTTE